MIGAQKEKRIIKIEFKFKKKRKKERNRHKYSNNLTNYVVILLFTIMKRNVQFHAYLSKCMNQTSKINHKNRI